MGKLLIRTQNGTANCKFAFGFRLLGCGLDLNFGISFSVSGGQIASQPADQLAGCRLYQFVCVRPNQLAGRWAGILMKDPEAPEKRSPTMSLMWCPPIIALLLQ